MMRSIMTLFAILLAARVAAGQSWVPPAENQRCPSKWGTGDERGSGNLMKPEQVLKAAKLIRTGEVIELGHVLFPGKMPFCPGRYFPTRTSCALAPPHLQIRVGNHCSEIEGVGE